MRRNYLPPNLKLSKYLNNHGPTRGLRLFSSTSLQLRIRVWIDQIWVQIDRIWVQIDRIWFRLTRSEFRLTGPGFRFIGPGFRLTGSVQINRILSWPDAPENPYPTDISGSETFWRDTVVNSSFVRSSLHPSSTFYSRNKDKLSIGAE